MTIPHFLQKFNGDYSLSSALRLPLKHRIISQKSNASKTQLHHPSGKNSLPFYKVKQEVNGRLQNGYDNKQMQDLGHQRGRNGNNNTSNTHKALEMVGPPLTLNAQLKGRNTTHKGRMGELFHSSKGPVIPTARVVGRKPKKDSPLTSFSNKRLPLTKQLKDASALREKTPLDEEIIVMGAPLIFSRGNKNVLTISKHTEGNASNIFRNRTTSFHQKAYTPQKIQRVNKTKTSLNQLALHTNTTLRNDKESSLAMSPKNIQNHTPSAGSFHKQENNKMENLLRHNRNKTSNQSGSHKETFGNRTVAIAGNFLPNNVSLKHLDSAYFDKQTFSKSGNQLQSIEQKQTDFNYETEQSSNAIIKEESLGNNASGHQEYNAKENHGSEETDSISTDKVDYGQENLPPFPEENPEEKDVEDLQIANDDSSNVSNDREEGEADGQFQGKAITPASNQRYMPVDDFGSPFYGNETGN